jgi:hypothetical protein
LLSIELQHQIISMQSRPEQEQASGHYRVVQPTISRRVNMLSRQALRKPLEAKAVSFKKSLRGHQPFKAGVLASHRQLVGATACKVLCSL